MGEGNVIPAKAHSRRQDAEANIGVADGPKEAPREAAHHPASLLGLEGKVTGFLLSQE
jgi:hypothetical protein